MEFIDTAPGRELKIINSIVALLFLLFDIARVYGVEHLKKKYSHFMEMKITFFFLLDFARVKET